MSKRELVQKVLNNGEAERVPIGFWFHYVKDELADGFKDPSIVEANMAGHKKFFTEFQPDIVKIMTDGYFLYPNELFLNAKKAADLAKIAPLPKNHPWFEQQVAHAKTLTGFFGGEVFSFYNIFSPATIFKFARGKEGEKTLTDFILEDKEAVIHAFSVAAEDIAGLSARVISEGKADGIYYSTQDIGDKRITEELWKSVVVPADIKVLEGANKAGKYNILHICGYEGHRNKMEHYVDYPAQIINWAASVEGLSLGQGKKLFKGKPVIGGFGNTVKGVLYKGGKQEIEAETARLLAEAGRQGVILGADCTIPRDTNLDHLRWVSQAAQ